MNLTDNNSVKLNLDKNVPFKNLSNDISVLLNQFMSSVHRRQVRNIVSYCKELPKIENTRLVQDDTIKHQFNNETVYSGSILLSCQYGFKTNNSSSELFRLTCQNGDFYPKTVCIGNRFNFESKFYYSFLFMESKENLDVHFHHQLILHEVQLLTHLSTYLIQQQMKLFLVHTLYLVV